MCRTRETAAKGVTPNRRLGSHDLNLFQVRIIIKRDAVPLAKINYMRGYSQSQ